MRSGRQIASVIRPPCDVGVVESASETAPCSPRTGRWVLAATIIGSSMAFIDGTVVNLALPVLQSELRASTVDLQWVIESYALFLAALLLVGGAAGDRFGRRRVYALGIALFAAASVWCGLAPDVGQLILARALQGIGGALLIPGSLAIIAACFGEADRGRAIGTWSGFTALTTALGPVMGGWLVEQVSWRAIFFINVAPAFIVLIILYRFVPESRDDEAAVRLDFPGALCTVIGLGCVIYGLLESSNLGLDHPLVLGTIGCGLVLLILFILIEARSEAPMVPLGLFRSRTFSGANLLTLLLYASLSGALFFLPFNLIQVQNYTATAAGGAFLPLIVLIFLLSSTAGKASDRFGARPLLIMGPMIVALGYALMALPAVGGSYWTTFFPAMSVLGLGMALSVAPLTSAVMGSVDSRRSGLASGVNNAVSRVAGLLAIAILGIFIMAVFNDSLDSSLAAIDMPLEIRTRIDAERIKLAGAVIPADIDEATAGLLKRAVLESYVKGFRFVMMLCAALAVAGAMLAGLMIKKPDYERGEAPG